MIAPTPEPPYYAVIFTNRRTSVDEGYGRTAEWMVELAQQYAGYFGHESFRQPDGAGVTISYWDSLESIRIWKAHADHKVAQQMGREKWYSAYKTRICLVERDYGFGV